MIENSLPHFSLESLTSTVNWIHTQDSSINMLQHNHTHTHIYTLLHRLVGYCTRGYEIGAKPAPPSCNLTRFSPSAPLSVSCLISLKQVAGARSCAGGGCVRALIRSTVIYVPTLHYIPLNASEAHLGFWRRKQVRVEDLRMRHVSI